MKKFEQKFKIPKTSTNFYSNTNKEKDKISIPLNNNKDELTSLLTNELNNLYNNLNKKTINNSMKINLSKSIDRSNNDKNENDKNNIFYLEPKKHNQINLKTNSNKEINEIEFSNNRVFQKDIMKKIFRKETGDLINFLKINNQNSKNNLKNFLSPEKNNKNTNQNVVKFNYEQKDGSCKNENFEDLNLLADRFSMDKKFHTNFNWNKIYYDSENIKTFNNSYHPLKTFTKDSKKTVIDTNVIETEN